MRRGIMVAVFFWVIFLNVKLPAAEDVTKSPMVLKLPEMDQVQIKKDVLFKEAGGEKLVMDIYYPPALKAGEHLPAIVFVLGFPNSVQFGKLKEWRIYMDWARLAAVSGFAGVLYETTSPETDIGDLLDHLRRNAAALSIDENRFALWSSSGNVLTALTVLMGERQAFIRCAALYYGLMLAPDQKFLDSLIDLNKQVKFSMAGLDKIKNWHRDLPLFIARAGKDTEVVNQGLDHFAASCLANNVPLTLLNYAEGRHGFDMVDDTDQSREIIRNTMEFFKFYLRFFNGQNTRRGG